MEKTLYLSDSMQGLINNHVTALELDKSYTFYNYLATLNNLTKQASIYKSEGDIERAYIYLLRFCVFTLEKLPSHPDYNNPKFITSKDKLKKDAVNKLSELESMKENLTGRYKKLQQEKQKNEQIRLEKQREEKQRLESLAKEKAEKEKEEQRLKAELAEQKRLEREKKRVEDMNQEERDLIKRRLETEKSLRKNRLEQQALLIRAEAELEDRRQREFTQQLEQLEEQKLQHQQQHIDASQPIVDLMSDSTSFVYSTEIEVETPDTKSPTTTTTTITTETTPTAPPSDLLSTDDLLNYLQVNEKLKKTSLESDPSIDSTYLVDPTFATPPQPVYSKESLPSPQPSAPTVATVEYNNQKPTQPSTPAVQVVQYDSNHQFGYPSIDQQQQQHIEQNAFKYQPPPPQQPTQPQSSYIPPPQQPIQSPTNGVSYTQQHNLQQLPPQYSQYNHPQFNSLPPNLPYQPVFNNKNQPIPTYLRSPTLPQNAGVSPQHTNQQRVGVAPQSYLAMAQQQQQQQQKNMLLQQQQGQPIQQIAKQSPNVVQTATAAAGSAAQASPKPNIDSSEASKKYSKLRKVIIGAELFNDFMKMAESNTRRQIETCGILSGTLSNDVFKVTTLIIPKQEGTTDTCNTIEEHELFEYQLENDLLTLGWIHTHPTQDCFLSAVDVHTHCSYQYLLQEAIAVVISPMANPNFGIFRLTDPPGIQTVQKCKLKSFHPHPPVNGVPIYTRVDHVEIDWKKQYSCKVVDLRNKK